jgi:hypothetical protein
MMAARKTAEEKDEAVQAQADEAKADDKDTEGRADGPISLSVEEDASKLDGGENYKLTKDIAGRPVGESYSGREYSTLDNEVKDPTIVQPSPGGPTPEAGIALGHNG